MNAHRLTAARVREVRDLYHDLLDREPWLTDVDLADAAQFEFGIDDRAALEYLAHRTNFREVDQANAAHETGPNTNRPNEERKTP